MTWRKASRAATIALFATAAGVVPASLRAQDTACDRGDLEVFGLEFRGNRAVSDADLADIVAYLASIKPGPKASEIPLLQDQGEPR